MGGRGRGVPRAFRQTSTGTGRSNPFSPTANRGGGGGGGSPTEGGNQPYVTGGATFNNTGTTNVNNRNFKQRGDDETHDLLSRGGQVKLSSREKRTVESYTRSARNSSAYSNFASGSQLNQNYRPGVERMDRVVGRGSLKQNTVMYREIRSNTPEARRFLDSISEVGATFTDTRFVSTTTGRLGGRVKGSDVRVVYHMPRGTRGLYLGNQDVRGANQREFISARFLTHRTMRVTTGPDGVQEIHVKVYPR